MAHSLSAKKRIRQNETRRSRNRANRSHLRSEIKKLRQAMDGEDGDKARSLLPQTISLIDKMVKTGLIHDNAGSRYKSRLTRRFNRLPGA